MFAKMTSFQTVFGTNGADTRAGSALSEFFSLGYGNDTVLFGPGSGIDTMNVVSTSTHSDRVLLGAGS